MRLPGLPDQFVDAPEPDDIATRVRAAIRRSAYSRRTDLTPLCVVISSQGVRVELRADYAKRLRRSDAAIAFLVEREQVKRGSVLVLSRESDGARVLVLDLGPGAD